MNFLNKIPRRKFLRQIAIVSAAAVIPMPSFAMSKKPAFKMGLQLFTIRDAMKKNPVTTLKKLRKIGYRDTEIYGYNAALDQYYGMKSAEFKALLDDLQMTATSGH